MKTCAKKFYFKIILPFNYFFFGPMVDVQFINLFVCQSCDGEVSKFQT